MKSEIPLLLDTRGINATVPYHESLQNLTPAEVYYGTGEVKLKQRKKTKIRTLKARKKQYQKFKLN